MLDSDLAKLYGVETRALNQAVKRNIKRFPIEFMFQLSREEMENWKSQIVMSKSLKMGLRRPPFAFMEHGVAMLSSVLNSERAIDVNIAIIKTFVHLRELIVSNKVLAARLNELENKMEYQGKDVKTQGHDIKLIFKVIRKLIIPPPSGGRTDLN